MKLFNKLKQSRGFSQILLIVAAAVLVMVVVSVIPVSVTTNTQVASDYLIRRGYVVLAAGEYQSLSDKVDALKVSADAAVVNAEAAAATAQTVLTTLLLHNENEVFLYPDSVSANVTFTAGTPTDTFGAWAEIVDSNAVTLSSKFAANDGYLIEITTRNYSDADEIYIIEMATDGAGANVIGRVKVRSDWTYVLTLKSSRVTTGDTIYYRMKAQTAGATLKADFRYYYR